MGSDTENLSMPRVKFHGRSQSAIDDCGIYKRDEYNLLGLCLDVHMHHTGAGNLPLPELKRAVNEIERRLEQWTPDSGEFDAAVKTLVRVVLNEGRQTIERDEARAQRERGQCAATRIVGLTDALLDTLPVNYPRAATEKATTPALRAYLLHVDHARHDLELVRATYLDRAAGHGADSVHPHPPTNNQRELGAADAVGVLIGEVG